MDLDEESKQWKYVPVLENKSTEKYGDDLNQDPVHTNSFCVHQLVLPDVHMKYDRNVEVYRIIPKVEVGTIAISYIYF